MNYQEDIAKIIQEGAAVFSCGVYSPNGKYQRKAPRLTGKTSDEENVRAQIAKPPHNEWRSILYGYSGILCVDIDLPKEYKLDSEEAIKNLPNGPEKESLAIPFARKIAKEVIDRLGRPITATAIATLSGGIHLLYAYEGKRFGDFKWTYGDTCCHTRVALIYNSEKTLDAIRKVKEGKVQPLNEEKVRELKNIPYLNTAKKDNAKEYTKDEQKQHEKMYTIAPENVTEGMRNMYLHSQAGRMRAYDASEEAISKKLFELNDRMPEPLDEGEVMTCIKSAMKYKPKYYDVHRYNEEWAMVRLNGAPNYIRLKESNFYPLSKRHMTENTENEFALINTKKGLEFKPAFPKWCTDPAKLTYEGVDFVKEEDCPANIYNTYLGQLVTPEEGDVTWFKDYIFRIICSNDKDAYTWIINWFADLVQNPTGPKIGTAILLEGPPGQGKSYLSRFMEKVLGKKYVFISSSYDRVFGRFNLLSFSKPLIGLEEALFFGGKKQASDIKDFITNDDGVYETKYASAFTGKNVSRVIATTNNVEGISLDNKDRRWTVLTVEMQFDLQTKKGREESAKYWNEMHSNMEEKGRHVLYWLLNHKVDKDLIRVAYENTTKKQMIFANDPILRALHEFAEEGEIYYDIKGKGKISTKVFAEVVNKFENRQYPSTPHTVSKKLRRHTTLGIDYKRSYMASDNGLREKRCTAWQFPPLHEFRKELSRLTGQDYPNEQEPWKKWGVPEEFQDE